MWYRLSKKQSKKIVFLDIDGVVNDFPNHDDKTINEIKKDFHKFLHEDKINLLNKIVDEVNPDFVLSSYWRKHFSIKEVNKLFKDSGFKGSFIDKTSNHGEEHKDRWKQIKKSLEQHNPDKYVILDDGKVVDDKDHMVQTVKIKGLQEKDIDKAISLLKGK